MPEDQNTHEANKQHRKDAGWEDCEVCGEEFHVTWNHNHDNARAPAPPPTYVWNANADLITQLKDVWRYGLQHMGATLEEAEQSMNVVDGNFVVEWKSLKVTQTIGQTPVTIHSSAPPVSFTT